MAAVSINEITDAVISGIEQAQDDYEKMSGGEWLWNAAEYVITTYIAREIHTIPGSKSITVEHSGLSAVTDAGAINPGPKPRKARLNGRFDLLLWWANNTPRAVIEVKNQLSGPSSWYSDIERITTVLNIKKDDSSFNFGLFAYYYSTLPGKTLSAEQKIINKLQATEDYIKKNTSDKFQITQKFSNVIHDRGEHGAWAAACIIIKRIK